MPNSNTLTQLDRQAIENRLREEVEAARAALLQALPAKKGEAVNHLQDAVRKLNDLVMSGKLPEG